jgi:hypothetical protein
LTSAGDVEGERGVAVARGSPGDASSFSLLVVILLIGSLATAAVYVVFSGPGDALLQAGILEIAAGILVFVAVAMPLTWVRRVVLTRERVRFESRVASRVVRWSELGPPEHPLLLGEIRFPVQAKDESGDGRIEVALTRTQAVALLNHASCPRWDLPPAVAASLGISPALESRAPKVQPD